MGWYWFFVFFCDGLLCMVSFCKIEISVRTWHHEAGDNRVGVWCVKWFGWLYSYMKWSCQIDLLVKFAWQGVWDWKSVVLMSYHSLLAEVLHHQKASWVSSFFLYSEGVLVCCLLGHDITKVSAASAEGGVEVMSFILVCWAVEEKMCDGFSGWSCSPAGVASLAFVHVCAVKPEEVSIKGDVSAP